MNKTNEAKKPLIICVDDEKIILDSLNRQLQRYLGDLYEFEFCENAEEAIELIKELREEGYTIMMLISDQIMPGMPGDQFLIKMHEKYPKLIKILLTGQASLDSAINAINKANLYRYITKPWSEDDFLLTVKKGLQEYNLLESALQQADAFKRFFPHQFLECLCKESALDIKLGDHVQRELSVLFSDIRHFTTISESMTPEENYTFINEYLSYIEPTIQKNRGFIDKYIGDAVMALFYTPEDALKAALDMQAAIRCFNEDHKDEKYFPIESGIGLHVGNLMLGIVGVESRMQGTVISDVVNIASRLQDLASFYDAKIIASYDFVHKLKNVNTIEKFSRFLGKTSLKGKKQNISIFEIISESTDPYAEQKIKTKNVFSEGLHLFINKKFAEACVKFKYITQTNPHDMISAFYLNRSADCMIKNVTEDWQDIYFSK